MVGAGSVVTRDVADHVLVVGNPARQVGWVCRCGEIVARASRASRGPPSPAARAANPGAVPVHSSAMHTAPKPIALSSVVVDRRAEALVLEVLRSGHFAQGPMVEQLEERFAVLCGVGHAVAVSNGTVSLVAALTALGIGAGDEVITSPFTFVATINAIIEVGATAVLADISPVDFCLDLAAVAAAVTPRTAAIMPVHLYGQMADMAAIAPIAVAARVGHRRRRRAGPRRAAIGDRSAGSFGVGSFSLYATKNVTTGEGGIVTTDDPALADRLRMLRNQGMRASLRVRDGGPQLAHDRRRRGHRAPAARRSPERELGPQ